MKPTGWARSSDGLRLAYYLSQADPGVPTVLAVHGYPDNASVWEPLVAAVGPGLRVLRFDVRGTGYSDQPADRGAYRLELLAHDAAAVLTAAEVGPAHLLGHDWGSVQGWHFVTAPQLQARLLSFTSISGPNPAYLRPWIRQKVAARDLGPVWSQLAHSAYIGLFKLPWLPELAWRSGLIDRVLSRTEPAAERSWADKLAGLQLYRVNLLTRRGPRPLPVELPVLVLAPTGDRYIRPDVAVETPRPYVADLQAELVPGGHWLPLTDAGLLARLLTDFIASRSPGRAA